MLVTIEDLTYTVPCSHGSEKLVILDNVSAFFQTGQLTGLMGPSGSGKTTLLDILAGRKTAGKIDGKVHFGGRTPSLPFLRRFTGYVEQFDTLIPNLTVEEMLMYTCEMKSPVSESYASKMERVDRVIEALALGSCRKTVVGSTMRRGISGGQAKRANIGLAMVTNPRVLFLDEPTSGLDSYTANEVMKVVKSLADTGITIVATIHAPSQFTFSLLDRLFVIVHGRTVYFGENGAPAVKFFLDQNVSKNDNPDVTTAEWLTDAIVKADRKGKAAELADTYSNSQLRTENDMVAGTLEELQCLKSSSDAKLLDTKRSTETPAWFGLKTMFKWRSRRDLADPAFLGPRIGDKLVVAFIILTLYWNVGASFNSENLPNQSSMLFMVALLPGFTAVAYVPAIILERPLFVRERSDGMYRVITYLLFKMGEELAVGVVIALIFSVMAFFPTQLSGSFLLFFLAYFFTMATGIALAYFISALSPNMDVANAAVPAYVTCMLFFAGLIMRWCDIPSYWKWFAYIDFIRYGWGGLMINQFESAPEVLYVGNYTVLQYYSLESYNKWAFFGYLTCFFIVFSFGSWCALAWKKHGIR